MSNVFLNTAFNNAQSDPFGRSAAATNAMTIGGTAAKTGILLGIAGVTSLVTYSQMGELANIAAGAAGAQAAIPQSAIVLTIGGMIAGLILSLVTIFKQSWAPVTAPLYAAAEGLFLGGLTGIANAFYPGIAIQAILLTFGILALMLLAYQQGWIRNTPRFQKIIMFATGGIMLTYLATFVLGFFGIQVPYIHGSGPIGIGFSLFVVGIAAFNLIIDFDFIEEGAMRGYPKKMEWMGAFGLMVTLVWLYVEILRLLMKLQDD